MICFFIIMSVLRILTKRTGLFQLTQPLFGYKIVQCEYNVFRNLYYAYAKVMIPSGAYVVSYKNEDDLRTDRIVFQKIFKRNPDHRAWNYWCHYADFLKVNGPYDDGPENTLYNEGVEYKTKLDTNFFDNDIHNSGFHFMLSIDALKNSGYLHNLR